MSNPKPIINSFSSSNNVPNNKSGSVNGGTYVTFIGSNFEGITSIYFGNEPVSENNITINENMVYVKTPAHASGTVLITINSSGGSVTDTTNDGISTPMTYTYLPYISYIDVSYGVLSGNTTVSISGIGFTGIKNVFFGINQAFSFTFVNDSRVVAKSPFGTSGVVDIRIDTINGVTSIDPIITKYTYVPYISSITPTIGKITGGTLVNIYGLGFTDCSTVFFGSIKSTNVYYIDDTHIKATSPTQIILNSNNSSTTVDVTLSNANGQSSIVANDKFTYLSLPTITKILPSGAGLNSNIPITITGSGFLHATDISFGNVLIPYSGFTINNDSQITVKSPIYDTSGLIYLDVLSANGISNVNVNSMFTYYDDTVYNSLPVITSLDPSYGPITGYSRIIIHGSNFYPNGITPTVTFNDIQTAMVLSVNNNLITCYLPPGNAPVDNYQVNVNITNGNGTSINNANSIFTYNSGNPIKSIDTSYNGIFYAIYGNGGFHIEQGFPTIRLAKQLPISQFDLTNALQLRYDVRLINQKLGITKDSNNISILNSSYDSTENIFPVDSITITANEFINNMTASQVVSVGTYSTLYTNFSEYVNIYFSYPIGFSTLFSNDYNINYGVFDANAFITIINGNSYVSSHGDYINDLSGSITINNINTTLRYIIDSNIFNNRNPNSGNTATDRTNNYGMKDGFIAGDLILVPAGTTITLELAIEPEITYPTNNVGPSNVKNYPSSSNCIDNQLNYSSINNNTLYTQKTVATTTNISTVLTAPLLLILDNLS